MKGLLKSFVYALNGLKYMLLEERNFRIHITAIFFVLYFSVLYGLSSSQYAVLILILSLVPALELINTAIEKTVDIKAKEFDENAKISKDASAGAVLVLSIGAVGIALALFSDFVKLKTTLLVIMSLPHLPILIVAVVLAVYFIFFFGKKRDK